MREPYVYEEMVGMQLVNRLFNTHKQTTHADPGNISGQLNA